MQHPKSSIMFLSPKGIMCMYVYKKKAWVRSGYEL